ncbi:hypothetical protein [Phnomibacter sp. MR]|uniref:hypothetical protein n=1 Tax=Phnomibacter sp. MR TaxID=3042318 RepID=UPI003A7FA760
MKTLKAIGYYQIAGGIVGFLMLLFSVGGNPQSNKFVWLILIGATFLFGLSIFAGIACIDGNKKALQLSIINQLLQLFGIVIVGISFSYSSGLHFRVGVDLTRESWILFKYGCSDIRLFYNLDKDLIFLDLNLVAMVVLIFLMKISTPKKEATDIIGMAKEIEG